MQPVMYKLEVPQSTDHDALLAIWELSVKATHHFLSQEDIEFYRNAIIENKIFDHVSMTMVRDTNNSILGFMGVSGDTLEMIFLHPHSIGKGIGKFLITHAIDQLNISKVDVNEQNEEALKFYEHFGFKVIARSELDGTVKPFPILHMQRMNSQF